MVVFHEAYMVVFHEAYMVVFHEAYTFRVAKFKHPRIIDSQKISEDNQKLQPSCPPDYQILLLKN